MDLFSKLKQDAKLYLAFVLLLNSSVLLASWWVIEQIIPGQTFAILIALGVEAAVLALIISAVAANYILEPLKYLWQAIVHVSPEGSGTSAPNLKQARLGRELVTGLALQVYQLASSVPSSGLKTNSADLRARTIAANLPLPILVMNDKQDVVFANEAAHKYLGKQDGELLNKNLYSLLDLAFPSHDTFDKWLAEVKNTSVTAAKSWEHVRLKLPENAEPLQFDMAAYYNKQNPSNAETIITLFDHTKTYSKEDSDVGFIALAVHELRTPLTLLRGYIEVFEEELAGKLDPELTGFMRKMQASAQQLAAFVNNILNVARVEADQLTLQLNQENWNDIVSHVASDLKLRATLMGKTIELQLDNHIPAVAADRVSLYEVLANLVDNAIKYSGDSSKIIIKTTMTESGEVETTIQDFGVGIPTNVVPHLFEKFYRSHATKQQIGGTGLGLYLSKAIVGAHGGNIWVRSKEGEGSTFGFTLRPYAQLAGESKSGDNELVRSAHGWIKNHSLYRR